MCTVEWNLIIGTWWFWIFRGSPYILGQFLAWPDSLFNQIHALCEQSTIVMFMNSFQISRSGSRVVKTLKTLRLVSTPTLGLLFPSVKLSLVAPLGRSAFLLNSSTACFSSLKFVSSPFEFYFFDFNPFMIQKFLYFSQTCNLQAEFVYILSAQSRQTNSACRLQVWLKYKDWQNACFN